MKTKNKLTKAYTKSPYFFDKLAFSPHNFLMEIQCQCKKFKARLNHLKETTPGRLQCYCDDCQTYLHYIGRTDVLNSSGGSEIIPVYPSDIEITEGKEFLTCLQLSPKGLVRFYTSCCNTPIGNTRAKFPWFGVLNSAFEHKGPHFLEQELGPIKSAIYGRFASSSPPKNTSDKLKAKDALVVLPFVLKGFLFKKYKPNPFFKDDGHTPITEPKILTKEERANANPCKTPPH